MWTKRIKDIVAMLLIGDGALTLIAARNRALVWRFGPERLRKSTSWQAATTPRSCACKERRR